MGLFYKNLDGETRKFMLEELEMDLKSGTVYISPRLNSTGQQGWVILLKQAIEHDDTWLENQLSDGNLLNQSETSHTKSGKIISKQVQMTAAQTLAEGEFNRYYIRGVCRRAINESIQEVEIYRGKEVQNPRAESQTMVGQKRNCKQLLDDLRRSKGVEPALGLPRPNSGLTVCLL